MGAYKMSCKECGDILSDLNRSSSYASHRKDGSKQMKNLCRTCDSELTRVVKDLVKTHPRPPSGRTCACCGRVDRLHLDHYHGTKAFRGYICRSCNCGIGMLGDSKEGVVKALVYLMDINVNSSASGSSGQNWSEDCEPSSVSCEKSGSESE